jgi:sugar lactone lactonase YvrE
MDRTFAPRAQDGLQPVRSLRLRIIAAAPQRAATLLLALAVCAICASARAQVAPAPCTQLGGSFCAQTVGSTSGAQNVTVTAETAGTVSSVGVLTLGVSGLDFAPGAGALSCPGAQLNLNDTCLESVTFTPAYPGTRSGAVVLLDSGNHVLGATVLSGTGVGGLGVLVTGNILPVAGDGDYEGPIFDGDQATSASLNHPSSVTLDGAGNMYIADRYHNRIRKVTAATGVISTLAGNGDANYAGDGLASTDPSVSVNTPWGVALDGAGNLYIADTGNNRIREIVAASGVIETIAGTRGAGSTGDNGPAIDATLNQPQGVSVDAAGDLYIADTYNNRIRKVDLSGTITTVAGNGTAGYSGDGLPASAAALNLPFAVAFDPAGAMYIPDSGNNAVRAVSATGVISTFAGTGLSGYTGDHGPATAATLFSPSGVATDAAGNVYIADTQNAALRKVSAAHGPSFGAISTIAENDMGVYLYNNGGPYAISIYGPIGLTIDGAGNLYFADSLNMRIREVQSNFAVLDYLATAVRQGSQSTPQAQTIENDGNAPLNIAAITPDANAAINQAHTTCATALAADADCVVDVVFAPSVSGNPLLARVGVSDAAADSPLNIELVGDATRVTSTTTTLNSSPNPSGFGAPVVFTAAVETGAGTGSLTGTVSFVDGSIALASAVHVGPTVTSGTDSTATATFTTSTLGVGSHAMTATYNNSADPTHFASTSAVLTQLVDEGTATVLTSSVNPSAVGQSVTLTAKVAAAAGGGVVPDGPVAFTDGASTLCNATLNSAGVATCTTTALANGAHAILATYAGDAANEIDGSISNRLNQDVQQPSSVQVASSSDPSDYGSPVSFIVTVTSISANPPTGMAKIFHGTTQIGTATLAGLTGAGSFVTSSLPVGSDSMTAAYGGDASNGPATSPAIKQVVVQAPTATTLTATPSPAIAGGPVAIAAAVKPALANGQLTGPAPTGPVTFTDNFNGATTSLGSAMLGGAGTATIHPALAPGMHSIVATYAGDTDDGPSTSSPLALPAVAATTKVVVNSSPNPSIVESAVAFTATVSGNGGVATGSVTFMANGVSMGSAALAAKGTATLSDAKLTTGDHAITAVYAGDGNDGPATSSPLSQVVNTIPTATALGSSTTSGENAEVILVATVAGTAGPAPTGKVTFTYGSTTIGSAMLNAVGIATLTPNLALGTYNVIASYGGDALHSPSKSEAVSVSGTATSFTLAVTPSSLTLATTQNATLTVTLKSLDSFSDTIGLGCGSLPTGVTCHFSSATVKLAANTTQTAQLTIDTDDPLTGGSSVTSMRKSVQRPSGLAVAGLSGLPAVLFSLLLYRLRRRNLGRFTFRGLALLLLVSLLSAAWLVSGCTGFSQSSAAPGTYVLQVNGTGVNSNLTRYQDVTLIVTK